MSGVPEVSTGIPSPPSSPPLGAKHTSATKHNNGQTRRGAVAFTIAEKSESFFCETLRSVFLGEGSQHRQNSLAMGVHGTTNAINNDYGVKVEQNPYPGRLMDSPPPEAVGLHDRHTGVISDWIEMWDYIGGIRFRGFVVEKPDKEKAMFIFFHRAVIGGDLKAGLTALLELCEVDYFSCDRLVVCIDRHVEPIARDTLVKDLGWIGFSLTTLEGFTQDGKITSDRWLFMDMET